MEKRRRISGKVWEEGAAAGRQGEGAAEVDGVARRRQRMMDDAAGWLGG